MPHPQATPPAPPTPSFAVIPGAQVHRILEGREREVMGIVEDAYRLHGEGATENPPSYFLRFPDRPSSRIIALPASVAGGNRVDGLKWISSFPENVAAGIPRASAVLILNDHATGYPLACLESSIISAARTAASAALAADKLSAAREGRERPRRVGFLGTGLIARYLHTYLVGTGWEFDEVAVHDLSAEHAAGFSAYVRGTGTAGEVTVRESAEDLIRSCDLVVFATVAATPHVTDPAWFAHNPLVLHVSLRDLSPEVVLGATNVVDDVEHCLKANTSLHLAEQQVGNRDFVDGTLHDVLTGALRPAADRPVIFSPFGLGVLDLALGKHVYDTALDSGELAVVEDFFHEMRRYG
ncbi:2,3-diaminopropionate biosynthesis protein SbnB [Streptomyces sp. NPDC041068]|uniref:2,3-diaminopropionate biosynthesis protein SbnB n=1 Tax=Streptomyces sp. NPDC041068 TaxID=3155130 RepID=UPI0033FC5CC5